MIKIRTAYLSGLLLVCAIVMLPISCTDKKSTEREHFWFSELRDDHPRLFFNINTFPDIKERALHEERDLFIEIKARVDALKGSRIVFTEPLEKDGAANNNHTYGTRAAEAAFIYLVLNDEEYLELTRDILVKLVDYYHIRNKNNLNINWTAFSRIHALAAYDWIYNDLTEKERIEIGTSLFRAIHQMIPAEDGGNRRSVFRRNTGGITTGFYGPPCLPWYTGLVFHHEGINDSLSEELLLKGYGDHMALLQHRSMVSGDDGGAAAAALNYAMGAYPWAEFNFFHSFQAATGKDISKEWPHVPKFVNYIFWNWLPGGRHFGYGDTRHVNNKLNTRLLHLHLSQMIHFYGGTQPEIISRAKWMRTMVTKQYQASFPITRFLLTGSRDEVRPAGPPENISMARHFEQMGQIFMRSGSGPTDTYALFTSGGVLTQHRHYDNNNFVIFRSGYVTLDSGTRPEPGLHLPYYFCRTVAHNCITIKMPGEVMPDYWGRPASSEERITVPNDGGQCNKLGSEVIAFDEKKLYAYIASDATDSYHQDKCNLAVRQFIYIPPNHFVIFDRVVSAEPDYRKRWLLHTAEEPVMIRSNEFLADHWRGRLICRTLLPENAQLEKVGGSGKQFWSDGRNWPLPELKPGDWNYGRKTLPPDTHDLFGQWRVEVTPDQPATDDIFLHLIQVGAVDSVKSMTGSELLKTDGMVGVSFDCNRTKYELMFRMEGDVGGEISISQNGRNILSEKFIDRVKPQKGL